MVERSARRVGEKMKSITSRRSLKVALLAAALLSITVSAWSADQSPKSASREELMQRVQAWYAALASGKFDDAWSFFGTAMKRDSPQDRYVANATALITRVSVASRPDISVATTPNGQPVGTAASRILITAKSQKEISVWHQTIWIQEPTGRGAMTWVLAGDEMQDGRLGSEPGVSPFATLVVPARVVPR